MAIAVLFNQASMTPTQYEAVIARLEEAGQGAPAGRLYHHAYGTGDNVHVFDVWDSAESFDAFGATLMPILGELGVDPGVPAVSALHQTIVG